MIDAVEGYASRGLAFVQLDDHFAFPVSLGGTTSVMNTAMQYVRSALNSAIIKTGSTTKLSFAPCTYDTAVSKYAVDWKGWGDIGYFDELIPQLYRTTFSTFQSEFDYTTSILSTTSKSLWVASGVRLDGSGDSTAENELGMMLAYSTQHGVGNSVWYARGIIETYPSLFQSLWL
jgi:uncharacterized lipoprotein YddW (UPF0748 family)